MRSPNVIQTGRSGVARADGPEFVARRLWRPVRVLVVDDVVTTGATLRAARAALERGGAGSVTCVAAAATRRDAARAEALPRDDPFGL